MVNNIIWAIVLFTFLTILSPPTILVLVVGLVPTGVAYICDKSDEKYVALCVGGINLCGVFPYVLSIWFDSHSLENAMDIVFDFFSLMIMYSSAGIGWAFYRYVPPIISEVLDILAKRRLAYLHRVQKNLVEEWGVFGSQSKQPSLSDTSNDVPKELEKEAAASS